MKLNQNYCGGRMSSNFLKRLMTRLQAAEGEANATGDDAPGPAIIMYDGDKWGADKPAGWPPVPEWVTVQFWMPDNGTTGPLPPEGYEVRRLPRAPTN